jgi:hypothetical protein
VVNLRKIGLVYFFTSAIALRRKWIMGSIRVALAVLACCTVCAARGKGVIYRHGRKKATVAENRLIKTLVNELEKC